MKKRNLVTAMILVTLLLLGTANTAYAAKTSGSIVVQNAVSGETYSIYRILDLDTDSEPEPSAYRYPANAAWEGFVNSAQIKDIYLKQTDILHGRQRRIRQKISQPLSRSRDNTLKSKASRLSRK